MASNTARTRTAGDALDRRAVIALRARVAGRVVVPGDADWDDARQASNLAVDQRPSALVQVDRVDDVVAVVQFARARGLRVATEGPGTGRGVRTASSLDETILVNTSHLRGVEIDTGAQRVRVEAGASWRDAVEPAAEHGFVVLHGSSPDVSVVGCTLGGGLGWLARRRGLAANGVTAIEIVTADGSFVWTDRDTEPELFWAARGGGGGFGIVTAIEIELYEAPDLYAGAMSWPLERVSEVLRAWRAWVDTVPDELTSVARIVHVPAVPDIPGPRPGESLAVVEAVFTGPEREGADLLAPLRALGPRTDTFAPVAPVALLDLHPDPPTPVPAIGDGILLERLPLEALDTLVQSAVPPLRSLEIRHLGGALATRSSRHGAIGAIPAEFVMFVAGQTPRTELPIAVGAARLYPPHTDERLRAVRAIYDPGELFADSSAGG